jgi:hypothetical protein
MAKDGFEAPGVDAAIGVQNRQARAEALFWMGPTGEYSAD